MKFKTDRLRLLNIFAYGYSALSLVIGPAILLSLKEPQDLDCSATPLKGEPFQNMGEAASVGGGVGIAIGLIILILLVLEAKKQNKIKSIVLPLCFMAAIFVGYLLLFSIGITYDCTIR